MHVLNHAECCILCWSEHFAVLEGRVVHLESSSEVMGESFSVLEAVGVVLALLRGEEGRLWATQCIAVVFQAGKLEVDKKKCG